MDIDLQDLATALAESPAVEAFQVGADNTRCYRTLPVDRWIAYKISGRVSVCVETEGTVECRARDDSHDYLGCSDRYDLMKIEPQEEASSLLEYWMFHPNVRAWVDEPDEQGVPLVVHVSLGEPSLKYLALRTETGWHLMPTAIITWTEVEQRHSFDASEVLGSAGWGLVTSRFDGCSRMGTTTWEFWLLRTNGPWLESVAHIELGETSWYRVERFERLINRSGAYLLPKPAGEGMVRLSVRKNYHGHGARDIRGERGIWYVVDGELKRTPK